MTVLPEQPGEFEISGYLTVSEPDVGTHELDFILPFHVEQDSASVEPSRLTRLETVRNGQRYRYGGRFLVPIDGPEAVTQIEIDRSGRKAEVLGATPVRCADCGVREPMEVPFAVILNARGAVVSARALRRVSTAVERAAGQGLGLWRFRPSSLKGRPVADWIVVTVRVEAGS